MVSLLEWPRRISYLVCSKVVTCCKKTEGHVSKKILVGTTQYLKLLLSLYGSDAKIVDVIEQELQR